MQDRRGCRAVLAALDEIRQFLADFSQAMALEETGMPVDASRLAELDRLRAQAAPNVDGERRLARSSTSCSSSIINETGSSTNVTSGPTLEGALEAYAAKEVEHRDDRSVEIVLIGSDSIETVRLTHANYFDGTARRCRSTSPGCETNRRLGRAGVCGERSVTGRDRSCTVTLLRRCPGS